MSKLTITEALAEIKTVGKRIAAKHAFVVQHLLRQAIVKDSLEREGGSPELVGRELQGVKDLFERVVMLRIGIQDANRKTKVTVGKETRTIAEWLAWRKDVSKVEGDFYDDLQQRIVNARNNIAKQADRMTDVDRAAGGADIVVHLSETELAKRRESIQQVLGELDGQLSLKNATTFVEV